ncbi:MAG: PDZ domain-containing protein [Acidobacteria bacterium]|nr:PDZ domain-containing protein [Acidobacteriota bacterium]
MSKSHRYLAAAAAFLLAAGLLFPSSYAQNRVLQLFSPDDSSDAFLGIRMTDVTEKNVSEYKLDSVSGVIVESVVEGSPAEKAALQEKDVLLEFDGAKVRSTMQLSRLVRETPVGREVDLVISRDGKQKSMKVQLEQRNELRSESRSIVIPAPFGEGGDRSFSYRFPDNFPMPEQWEDRGAPRLGITVQAITEQLADTLKVPGKRGVLVTSVREESPSAGKLQAGDVIIRADGRTVSDPANLRMVLQRAEGDTISLDVIRDRKEIKVIVNLPGDTGREGGTGREYKL